MAKGQMIKKNKKLIVVAIIVTAIMVGAIAYYTGNWTGFNEGLQSATPTTISGVDVDAASIDGTLNTTTFNHAATVAADGSVSSSTSHSLTLWINNTDDDLVAQDLYIRLVNPRTDKEGLHDNLEADSFEFGITEGGTTTKLFHDGDYIEDGWYYGDLSSGGSVQVTVTCTLESAVAGTFQDGQSYSCYLYIYQEAADYPTAVSFTITT